MTFPAGTIPKSKAAHRPGLVEELEELVTVGVIEDDVAPVVVDPLSVVPTGGRVRRWVPTGERGEGVHHRSQVARGQRAGQEAAGRQPVPGQSLGDEHALIRVCRDEVRHAHRCR